MCVEPGQAVEHCFVFLHVFFKGKPSYESRDDLCHREKGQDGTSTLITEIFNIFC